jgi:peptidoglycan/xylan/chitin deacetylase (PgdA/CDA1 family)
MSKPGTVFLMYHELALPNRATCHREPGYTRYVVSASAFCAHMDRLKRDGWHAKNASQALQSFDGKSACVTFDDGCETDLLSAAPLLKELGFGATSYITVGFLGQPGYLSASQVRSLSALGVEIGCHSQTHPYLPDLDDARLRDETAGAKDRLEQIAGVPVEHFSCPGGRWDRRVVAAVKAANFRSMATSRTAMNFAGTNPFGLARVAVLQNASEESVAQACSGHGLLATQLKERARESVQRLLGNSAYDSLRALLLGPEKSTGPDQR